MILWSRNYSELTRALPTASIELFPQDFIEQVNSSNSYTLRKGPHFRLSKNWQKSEFLAIFNDISLALFDERKWHFWRQNPLVPGSNCFIVYNALFGLLIKFRQISSRINIFVTTATFRRFVSFSSKTKSFGAYLSVSMLPMTSVYEYSPEVAINCVVYRDFKRHSHNALAF